MADLVSTPILALAPAGGIAIAGVVTGLDPGMLFAGACGGYWAIRSMPAMPFLDRTTSVMLSAVIAAWGAAAIAGEMCARDWIAEANEYKVAYLIAICMGYVAMPVLGGLILDSVKAGGRALVRWLDRLGAKND